MDDERTSSKRQKALADFGDFALQSEDLDAVLTEACRLVGEAMGTGRAKVLEIEGGGECLLVRAGAGWDPGVVGRVRLPMSERSSETFSIEQKRPVITRDIGEEDRFEVPAFMREAGVVALANVPVLDPGAVAAPPSRARGNGTAQFLLPFAPSCQQPDRVLAVVARHRRELVQDARALRPRGVPVPRPDRLQQFRPRRHADPPRHPLPPEPATAAR